MDEITELEKLVSEGEPESPPNNAPLELSKWAYHIAVIVIDAVTAYTLGMITIWYYGVIWFLGNAVVFFFHHNNWERAENNDKQEHLSLAGMLVAVASMLIVAVAVGGVYMYGSQVFWMQFALEAFAIIAFFAHAVMFAVYRFVDDTWQMNRQIAKAKANANKKVQFIEAAGTVIEANKKVLSKKGNLSNKHGGQVVDRAIAKVSQVDFTPRAVPMSADTEEPKGKTENFTGAGKQ
jgi:uncharacterized membrane protein